MGPEENWGEFESGYLGCIKIHHLNGLDYALNEERAHQEVKLGHVGCPHRNTSAYWHIVIMPTFS